MKQCYTYVMKIEYIMYTFQRSRVLSNDQAHTVICEGCSYTRMWKPRASTPYHFTKREDLLGRVS